MQQERSTPSPHMVRAIAVAAEVDPRTVMRVLEGKPTRALPRERVLRAMKALGLPASGAERTRR